jgi:iron(III) transport system ATP-binding protein
MRATLLEIQKRVNITTVFVTHDQSEAMSISDKIIVMNRGRVEQVGTPLEIYQKPSSEFIAGFVGFVNILEGAVKSIGKGSEPAVVSTEMGNFEILPSENDLSVGEKVFLVVRPEAVRIGSKGNGAGVNEYMGVVKSAMYEGSMVKYRVEVHGKLIIIDQFDPINQGFYQMGEECVVTLPQRVHIIKK